MLCHGFLVPCVHCTRADDRNSVHGVIVYYYFFTILHLIDSCPKVYEKLTEHGTV